MKQSILLAIIIFISITESIAQDLLLQDSTAIASLVDSTVQANFKENNIPGAVITVVHKGNIILTKGYGSENIENNIAVDANKSKFRVASITKTFTALAIMQLVERGKLDLHADIHAYLPQEEYQFDAPYSFTIHDLLTHTAGFEWSSVRVSKEAAADQQLETFVKTSMNKQVFEPGEVFYYSNKGYGILGHLIEKISGMKYQDYIDQHILPKLGMTESTTYQHTETHPINNIVTPYRWDGTGYQEISRQRVVNPAASTLNTTGRDMGRFMVAMLNTTKSEYGQLLNPETFDMMASTQYQSLIADQGMAYGMGVGHYRGQRSLSHGGGIEGFGSYYTFYPELDLGVFMVESGGENNAWFVFKNMFDALGKLIPKPAKEPINLNGLDVLTQAEQCAGLYQMVTVTQSTFEKGRRIFGIDEHSIKHIGEGLLQIGDQTFSPTGYLTYKDVKDGKQQLGFKINTDGDVQYLGYGSIYTTFERIKWYQSALALQITVGFGLLITLIFLVVRPLYRKIKRNDGNFHSPWIYRAAGLVLSGFGILLIGNLVNLGMTTGTHLVYKIGLIILTIGAIMSFVIPFDIYSLWNNVDVDRRDKVMQSFGLLGMVLVCICFWDINLIGMNWY